MPPRVRAPKTDDEKPPAKKSGGEICRQCWPRGWPAESGRNASCVHGQWSRDLPAPSEA